MINRKTIKNILKPFLMLAAIAGSMYAGAVYADATNIAGISENIQSTVTSMAVILQNIALVAGIGFIMASFFKFHQHKMNPQQIPLSQGLALLLIGAGLTLFPHLIPVASKSVLGNDAKVAQVGGQDIKQLIGGNS